MARLTRLVTLLAVLFLVAGCTSDDGAADEPTAAAAATESTTTTAAPTTTAATTTTTTEPAGPDRLGEIEALIEAYLASWETKDEPALRATVTDDFVLNEYIYKADTGKLWEIIGRGEGDSADDVVVTGWKSDWQNAIVGESVVTGNGPWTVRFRELWAQGGQRMDGIATYTVVDVDGTLKIARHSWAGFVWFEMIEF